MNALNKLLEWFGPVGICLLVLVIGLISWYKWHWIHVQFLIARRAVKQWKFSMINRKQKFSSWLRANGLKILLWLVLWPVLAKIGMWVWPLRKPVGKFFATIFGWLGLFLWKHIKNAWLSLWARKGLLFGIVFCLVILGLIITAVYSIGVNANNFSTRQWIIGIVTMVVLGGVMIWLLRKVSGKKSDKLTTTGSDPTAPKSAIRIWWSNNWKILSALLLVVGLVSWVCYLLKWTWWTWLWNFDNSHLVYSVLCALLVVGLMMVIQASLEPVKKAGKILVYIVLGGFISIIVGGKIEYEKARAKTPEELIAVAPMSAELLETSGTLVCRKGIWSAKVVVQRNVKWHTESPGDYWILVNDRNDPIKVTPGSNTQLPNGVGSLRFIFLDREATMDIVQYNR